MRNLLPGRRRQPATVTAAATETVTMMTVAVAEAGTTPSAPRGFQAPPGAMAPAAVGNTVLAPQATASQMASTVAPSLHRGCKIYNVFREQDLDAFLCVVAFAAQVEACLSLGLGLLLLFPYMVETRLEKREKPRKRRSAVRQKHVRLVLDPRRHADGATSISAQGSVSGNFASSNRRRVSRHDTITTSSVVAIVRSVTPLCSGEPTGVCSRRTPRRPSRPTNPGLTSSAPLSERVHRT